MVRRVVGLVALSLLCHASMAQNVFAWEADSAAYLVPIPCPGDPVESRQIEMGGYVAIATFKCYESTLSPHEFRMRWDEALGGLSIDEDRAWEVREAAYGWQVHTVFDRFLNQYGLVSYLQRPAGGPGGVVVLAFANADQASPAPASFAIIGSSRQAVEEKMLAQGWRMSLNQSDPRSLVNFQSDVKMVVRFDRLGVATGVAILNEQHAFIDRARADELIRLAGAAADPEIVRSGGQIVEIYIGGSW